jgi:hypothetical protein
VVIASTMFFSDSCFQHGKRTALAAYHRKWWLARLDWGLLGEIPYFYPLDSVFEGINASVLGVNADLGIAGASAFKGMESAHEAMMKAVGLTDTIGKLGMTDTTRKTRKMMGDADTGTLETEANPDVQKIKLGVARGKQTRVEPSPDRWAGMCDREAHALNTQIRMTFRAVGIQSVLSSASSKDRCIAQACNLPEPTGSLGASAKAEQVSAVKLFEKKLNRTGAVHLVAGNPGFVNIYLGKSHKKFLVMSQLASKFGVAHGGLLVNPFDLGWADRTDNAGKSRQGKANADLEVNWKVRLGDFASTANHSRNRKVNQVRAWSPVSFSRQGKQKAVNPKGRVEAMKQVEIKF